MRTFGLVMIVTVVGLAPAVRAQVQPQGSNAILSAEQQLASSVLPLPAEFRESATVLGYAPDGARATLRTGSGPFVCLSTDPKGQRFHVACYHRALEPFMARGRALRAQGITSPERIDSVRFAEVKSGALPMPAGPAALYSLTGPLGSYDSVTGKITGARSLFVIYIANATAESTGLSAKPAEGTPWIMYPGTPKAHIMFVPRM